MFLRFFSVCGKSLFIDNQGWIQDFREGVLKYRTLVVVSYRGSGEILLKSFLKLRSSKNRISGILRPSQCVIMSDGFSFRGFDQTPQKPPGSAIGQLHPFLIPLVGTSITPYLSTLFDFLRTPPPENSD